MQIVLGFQDHNFPEFIVESRRSGGDDVEESLIDGEVNDHERWRRTT